MSMQPTIDFPPDTQREQTPAIQNAAWLDVSDFARGVGFTITVIEYSCIGIHEISNRLIKTSLTVTAFPLY
jgi:hypothetical protein